MRAANASGLSGREASPASKRSTSNDDRSDCFSRGAKPQLEPTMSDFDNTDQGALFRNDDKTQEQHPDYRGSINVGGVDHWLSAWIKTSKKGTKYMSLSVKPKNSDNAQPKKGIGKALNDQVPFLSSPYASSS
jgi:hypothetical protein